MSDQISQYNSLCYESGCGNSESSHFLDSHKDHESGETKYFRGACLCANCNCRKFVTEKEFKERQKVSDTIKRVEALWRGT